MDGKNQAQVKKWGIKEGPKLLKKAQSSKTADNEIMQSYTLLLTTSSKCQTRK